MFINNKTKMSIEVCCSRYW